MKRIKSIFSVKFVKIKFTFESQLDRHMDSHTDNKPFKSTFKTCPKFVEGFKSQQLLNRHMHILVGKHIPCIQLKVVLRLSQLKLI